MKGERPQWAERVRMWLGDGQYVRLDVMAGKVNSVMTAGLHAVESRIENGAEHLETAGLWLLCAVYGHEPVADQCNKPEHDHCVYCRKSMPNSAHGPQY